MRLIKLLVISVFVLATIITSISLLFPSEVVVSRAIEINAPSQDIAYFVCDLNHWNTWMSEWKENKVTIKDSTAFISSQTIQLIKSTDSSARFNWVATGQPPYDVLIEWLPLSKGNYVIHWSFTQKVHWYPWEKFQTLLNEKLLGYKMEVELANLKEAILNK
jgi:hypothetical protein